MKATCGRALHRAALLTALSLAAACAAPEQDLLADGQVYAPGIDPRGSAVDGAVVGHRLLAAGEYELAIEAFTRAAADRGEIDGELLAGLGAANLGLGRLNQAEGLLRRATAREDAQAEDWNNLGVLLMETGRTTEAVGHFRRADAMSHGENVAIAENLNLALEKLGASGSLPPDNDNNYRLVRLSGGAFVLEAPR